MPVVLFVALREGVTLDGALIKTICANTTPRHVLAKVTQVSDIPRIISGDIVERVVHGEVVKKH